MQNLTKEDIQQHAVVNEQSVEIRVALPLTPLKTQHWAEQFCELFHFSLSDADWGADRFQALVTTQSSNTNFQCILCIEWLCEAIWLEPVGTQQSPNAIYQYLQNT
jgi:hypothetical protein